MKGTPEVIRSHTKTIAETLGRGSIHPFPARMAPGIALDALGGVKSRLRVLDPMAGSGTVLAVARAKGHVAYGVDLDPLAVLLAKVWTQTVDAAAVNDAAKRVLDRALLSMRSRPARAAYPSGSDEETRAFIRFWFDTYARRQLTALSYAIGKVREDSVRDVLWCGFSRLIITKSAGASLAMDLSHSRPHKEFDTAPVKPFNRFLAAVQTVVANCPQLSQGDVGQPAVVSLGDARALPISDASIDLVLTSPPYLNAIDYMRCSKFSLVWMGYNIEELRKIRGESVGAEAASDVALQSDWVASIIKGLKLTPRLSTRDNALLARYVWDMGRSLSEVSRVLKDGGRAVYVVGDSTVRGTFVRNSAIVSAVAEQHGLTQLSRHSRALPANRRYMPPPKRGAESSSIEGRMRREVVLEFAKSA